VGKKMNMERRGEEKNKNKNKNKNKKKKRENKGAGSPTWFASFSVTNCIGQAVMGL
jgi:hypothetical protein